MNPSVLLDQVRNQLFLDSLRQTQVLPPDRLAAYQARLAEKILRHARETVPFYRDRLDAVFTSDGSYRPEGFAEIPFLTRAEAQANAEALRTTAHPTESGTIRSDQTSGSTGRAFMHSRSTMADIASRALSQRTFEWNGLRIGQRTAEIRIDRSGLALPPLGQRKGWRHTLTIDADVTTQLAWLQQVRPQHLLTYASNLRALALASLERGTDLRLDQALTVSEMLDDDTRALCREAFGCAITDNYGTQENGYLAGSCAQCGGYHVAAEAFHVEILDDQDRPVGPGEIGRVVLTGFYNYAMPFIRYEVGDYAQRGAAHETCKISLPRLQKIMGRQRNMFTFPGGRVVWPNAFFRDIKNFVPVAQTQVVQEAPLGIALRFVRDPDGVTEDLPGLTAYLRERLDPRITVRLDERAELPRSKGGKYEDYLSLCSA